MAKNMSSFKLAGGRTWKDSHRVEDARLVTPCYCGRGYKTETIVGFDLSVGLGGELETSQVCKFCAKENEELFREEAERNGWNDY